MNETTTIDTADEISLRMARAQRALNELDRFMLSYTRVLIEADVVEIWIEENVDNLLSGKVFRKFSKQTVEIHYHVAVIERCQIKWKTVHQT
ncbi:MAG: hypothetical protein GKR93_12135 [Gammaproteobacteria bacterium]|nr:hypothetical protein [Gammaproteobacteria bacterium]